MRDWLERIWYRPVSPPWVLRLLARVYRRIAGRRAAVARASAERLPVPVIVVGNITVGGTGKTPCTLWLVEALLAMGRTPGILSRGYGGRGPFPRMVAASDDPAVCGDEPVLMAARSGVPVAVAPDRVAAGRLLLQQNPRVDVLVCDDGLQHYRLARDLEFCVVDGARGCGNGFLLPAGPLREPVDRMASVDMVLVNGADAAAFAPHALRFDLVADSAVNLRSGARKALTEFRGAAVDAVAGLGNPRRYFDFLCAQGLEVAGKAFEDHHRYVPADLDFGGTRPLLMTEKDAVKCRAFAQDHWWMVPVDARFEQDGEPLKARLRGLLDRRR
jgi:tetraacyldisaccharide 4'-kinase